MSVEKLDLAIANFIKAVAKVTNPHLVQSSVLQQANAFLDNIISSLPVPVMLDDAAMLAPVDTLIHRCERLHDLVECLPNFQLKLISDIPLLTSDEHTYWYCCLLQSTYQCFKSLRICKLLYVSLNYYYDLVKHVSICLNQLQTKVGNVAMLLQLLRIMYACLAGLPQETLEPSLLINAIVPYFKHKHKNVRISATNAAQFLISLVDEGTKRLFIVSQECLYDLINASGKEIPTSSLLKLLLAYGQLPSNCSLYLAEGVFLFVTKIAFQSSRNIEKKLAYAVIKMLAFHQTNEETKSIETKGENDPVQSQATPTSDVVVVNAVMADADKDTDAKSFLNILPQLNEQVEHFKAVCLKRERDTDGREIFKCLKEMLSLLEDHVSLLPEEASKDINVMLSNILLDLLDALMMTDENQHIRWGNYIMFNCWIIIKALSEKSANTVLSNSQVSQLINKVLLAIPMFIGRKDKNEIIMKSLLFFVEVLEDILFGTISLSKLDEDLSVIKSTLINNRVSSYGPLRVSTQIILSSLVTEDDHELILKDLIVDEKVLAESIQRFSALEDLKCVIFVLQKFNALAVIPENRAAFRHFKLLPILEKFSDKYSNTDVESLAAKLICSVLSDPLDDQQEENQPSSVIEKFVATYLQEENHSHSLYAGIKNMVTATTDVMSSDVRSDDNIPRQILHHAECLYLVMTACSDEFHRVLYKSDEIVDMSFLVKTAKLLKQLIDIYEDVPADSFISSALERQVTYISTKHLPELASISFKAMKDAYSDSLSDFLKQAFFISLMDYLLHLHFCIERWSRMDISVKEVLIDYGAFHLLLNELHTAPTTKIITDGLVYSILTSFYNVVLIPELAKRFRISITKKLLSCYLSSGNVGIRCLAKFSMSCMHMLLSQSEISQVSIASDEAEMMANCLKGIDPFFGGHRSLVTTIENLSHSPNNWQVFVDVGIVHSLVESALTENGSLRDCVLGALLNMIPEPKIDSLKQQLIIQGDTISSPVTSLLKSIPGFMELINTLSVTECKAINLLLSPLKKTSLEDVRVLYDAKRYADCWRFCTHLQSEDELDSKLKNKVLLYQAKCMYHTYNHEIMERIEQSGTMPGFEYKNMMRIFCNNRIVGAIKILTKLKSLALKGNPAEQSVCSNSSTSPITGLGSYVSFELEFYDNEADYMLDKALLDFLVYNTKEVRTCLLCHKATDNLIHSHYIPKSILQEFVKAMGLDPGASVFILAPPTDHPSDWHFKSAAKATLSMLCKKCDGEILSKDENLFKNNIFNVVYQRKCPGSHMLDCVITYDRYLYRFAVGLIFRNMAPLYSGICAEIGEFIQLHNLMQECRDVVLAGTPTANLKIFMLFLPSELPAYLPQVSGWDKYVIMTNSPYAAYKLLQPGEPMVPKKIYCFMVKIGVMIFITPLDSGLEMELENLCPFYQIHFSENQSVMLVPEDKERGSLIPQKLWWSFLGWAKKEVNRATSVAISVKPPVDLSGKFHAGLLARNILEGSSNNAAAQPVVANLLPPGFELNYDKSGTLPEKVIQVPEGHVILLHGNFKTSSGIKGYSILGRPESVNIQKVNRVPEKPAIYSIMQRPYVLVYLEHSKKKYVLKTGFSIDEKDHRVSDALPGCPTSMKDSEHLRELTEQIPDIVGGLLRSKGFRSLKSLIFWQESMKKHRIKDMFVVPPFDTRCTNDRCIYCDMRCDVCLRSCLQRHKLETFPTLSLVQTCSEACTKYLFSGKKECAVVTDKSILADLSLKGHTEILYVSFSLDDATYIGLKTHIFFSVTQSNDEAEGVFSVPSGFKYVKLWHHSIYKPLCIEYIIDDDFNAIELLNFKDSTSVFSSGEEKEMMHQFHEMLVRSGVVYQYFQNLTNDL